MALDDPTDGDPTSNQSLAKPAPLPDPDAVLQDPALSHDEKVDKLRRWSQDARQVETANDEGMRSVEVPSNLPAVQEALRQLGATETSATPDRSTTENEAADGS